MLNLRIPDDFGEDRSELIQLQLLQEGYSCCEWPLPIPKVFGKSVESRFTGISDMRLTCKRVEDRMMLVMSLQYCPVRRAGN